MKLPLKNFYMLRHGETVANEEGYAAGSLDTPLTINGHRQASIAAKIISSLDSPPDFIVHSDLSRTRDTAIEINKLINLPIFVNKDLAEQNYGDWQEVQWSKIKDHNKQGIIDPPNGEAKVDFYKRAMKALSESISIKEKTPLIVCHGGIFGALMDYLCMDNIDIDNCRLYEFAIQNNNESEWSIKNYE